MFVLFLIVCLFFVCFFFVTETAPVHYKKITSIQEKPDRPLFFFVCLCYVGLLQVGLSVNEYFPIDFLKLNEVLMHKAR